MAPAMMIAPQYRCQILAEPRERAWARWGGQWRETPRPAKGLAGPKTASRKIFSETPKTHQENATQTAGTHQRNSFWAYDFASGCAVAPNSAATQTFDERFKSATGGLTLQDSINLYQKQTGKTLTADQVQKMFTDSAYAKSVLMGDKSLHQVYRDILNTNIPGTQADAIKAGFEKLPWYQSIFHNPWYNPWQNSKYIAPDGHREAVYDRNGSPVTGNDYKGTFNFFGPSQAGDHKAADVDLYFKWGN